MTIPDATQTLGAAFSFGILLQAATAALLLYSKGHGSTIFKERRRLVLVIFLLFSLLWSQFDFINFMIPQLPDNDLNFCQITLIASSSFDQIARVAIGGFLLWSVGHTTKASAEKYGLGGLIGIRVVAGGFFVGFVRPQFKPVCLARSSLLPASVTVLALDGVIIAVIMVRMVTLGLLRAAREPFPSTNKDISKALMLTTLGFTLWTGLSVTMILGLESLILLLRTAVPATGLLILVSIVTLFPGGLLLPREEDSRITQEARSPFAAPPSRSGESFSSQSPIVPQTYTKGGLFVVNPSHTPNDSPTVRYQNSRNVEDDGSRKYAPNTTITQMEIDDTATINQNMKHTSSGIFGTILAAPLGVVEQQYQRQVTKLPNATTSTTISSTQLDQLLPVPRSPPRKKGLFGRSSSPPKKGVRKMGISAPTVIDTDSASASPFARMRTVDLATAAASERERREGNAARALVANRPAPRPPRPAGPEALQMSISTRRKEIKSVRAPPPLPPVMTSDNGLSVNANASGASLSPGIEDVRRRSPRVSAVYDKNLDEFDFSDASRGRVRTQTRAFSTLDSRRQNSLRSQMANQETVMYIKDIVYDQPGMVSAIISGVPAMIAKGKQMPSSPPRTPYSTTSILNRPRPYKQLSETGGTFFKSDPASPHHRRSKSSSSIPKRKSLAQSRPSSPTSLPALPPLPTNASRLKKLLPDGLRSMTVDEKILLLFPAPAVAVSAKHRRSSVPSIPRIPSLIQQGAGSLEVLVQGGSTDQRVSRRSSISFDPTPDLKQFSPKSAGKDRQELKSNIASTFAEGPLKDSNTYRFSAHTYGTLVEGSHDSWAMKYPIPGVPTLPEPNQQLSFTGKYSESTEMHDDGNSNWASLHSPATTIEVRGGRASVIQMGQHHINRETELPALQAKAAAKEDHDYNGEFITFMIEPETPDTETGIPTFFLDAAPHLDDQKVPTRKPLHTWHHRLGDDLPTFSGRKEIRQRTMPPPPPLLLSSSGRQAMAVVKKPGPEVIDSPGRAIKQIQAQLQQFEGPQRDSLGSILNHLPGTAPKTPSGANADRLGILADLEAEMVGQENHWAQMQHKFDRDSNSVMTLSPAVQELQSRGFTSPPPEIEFPSRSSSTRSIIKHSRRNNATSLSAESTSTESSQNSRASIWQQRLADAQLEYLENAPELLQKRNLNFLTLQKPLPQPGSPTPPESVDSADEGTQFDSDSEAEDELPAVNKKSTVTSLWEPRSEEPKMIVGHMWNATTPTISRVFSEPPAKSIRPAKRKISHPLHVTSTELWTAPQNGISHIPVIGLWGSRLIRPRSIVTRPKTQRPQRKSRRVTFLPDIVESPSPLPNKRGTLGLFLYPWGEKSDQPVYQPAPLPNIGLQVPKMLNSSPEAGSRALEQEEYESSFFDDYEDDDGQPNSDDEFDESTLWEIASLLQSTDVPSRNSLLPSRKMFIIEDYDDSGSENEIVEIASTRPSMVKFVPIQPLALSPRENLLLKEDDAPTPPAKDTHLRLPRPQIQTRESAESSTEPVKSRARDTFTLQALTSGAIWETSGVNMTLPEQVANNLSNLWGREAEELPPRHIPRQSFQTALSASVDFESKAMWTKAITVVVADVNATKKETSSLWTAQPSAKTMPGTMTSAKLWTAREKKLVTEAADLFMNGPSRNDPGLSSERLTTRENGRKPRTAGGKLSCLTSSTLWSPMSMKTNIAEHNWIAKTLSRPICPSSPVSAISGRFLPDPDNVFNGSPSTKASSLRNPPPRSVGELGSRAWWEVHNAAAGAVALRHADAQKNLSKPTLPVEQKKDTGRITATEAQWEAALNEAVKMGTPNIARQTATVAERKAAPAAAMSQTPVQVQRPILEFDSATRHPIFFTSSMTTQAFSVHPAMQGYVQPASNPEAETQSQSSLETCITGLWRASTLSVKEDKSETLWRLEQSMEPAGHPPIFTDRTLTSTLTKRESKLLADLPTLSSKSVWQPEGKAVVAATDKLHASRASQLWGSAPANLSKDIANVPAPKKEIPAPFTQQKSRPLIRVNSSSTRPLSALKLEALFEASNRIAKEIANEDGKHLSTHATSNTTTSEDETKYMSEKKERVTVLTEFKEAAWLAPPRYTLAMESMPLVTPTASIPAVPQLPEEIPQASLIPDDTAMPLEQTRGALAPVTIEAPQPSLKHTKTLAPTGRKSIWTAPVRASTISVSAGRRGSALWDQPTKGATSPPSLNNNVYQPQRRRMSSDVEEKKVEEDKLRIKGEGQVTWRPKWGLPEKPTDWLQNGAKRSSKVEFRY